MCFPAGPIVEDISGLQQLSDIIALILRLNYSVKLWWKHAKKTEGKREAAKFIANHKINDSIRSRNKYHQGYVFPRQGNKKHQECVSEVGEHISPGICVSPVRKKHITRDIGFPDRGTQITRGTCFQGGGTHITRDTCFPGGGTHITRNKNEILLKTVKLIYSSWGNTICNAIYTKA